MRSGVKTNFAKSLRRNMTDAESKLWYFLRAGRLNGHKFKRQAPIGSYIVDFVAPTLKLIVELDGSHHADQQEYDAARTRYLNSLGYRVLRFGDDEVLKQTDAVREAILNACNSACGQPSPPAPSPVNGRGEAEMRGSQFVDTPSPVYGRGSGRGQPNQSRRSANGTNETLNQQRSLTVP
ncbi:MAG: endonuclease domain-containing protein [Betaproteobacteria bacterium]|nr:endonuclease domain-containing protein [Betaproteobacteria bacterium]